MLRGSVELRRAEISARQIHRAAPSTIAGDDELRIAE
jgi:hypothetical protein